MPNGKWERGRRSAAVMGARAQKRCSVRCPTANGSAGSQADKCGGQAGRRVDKWGGQASVRACLFAVGKQACGGQAAGQVGTHVRKWAGRWVRADVFAYVEVGRQKKPSRMSAARCKQHTRVTA